MNAWHLAMLNMMTGAEGAVPFEKVLWRKQAYADNHVGARFLADLRTNSQIVLPGAGELLVASLRISTRFLCVVLFALLFLHLHLATLENEVLLVVGPCGRVVVQGERARAC